MDNRPVISNSSEYPNASFQRQPVDLKKVDSSEKPKRVKAEAVLEKGDVTVKKSSVWRRARHKLIAEDGENLKDYVVNDVLVPTVKNAISDIVINGIDILLYGEAKHGRTSGSIFGGNKNGPYIKYQSISNSSTRNSVRNAQARAVATRDSLSLDSFIFETRDKAVRVLGGLSDILTDYDYVTVGDLYDICQLSCPYTYHNFGWSDLSTVSIRLVRDGWLLDLPTPIDIRTAPEDS